MLNKNVKAAYDQGKQDICLLENGRFHPISHRISYIRKQGFGDLRNKFREEGR